jgi:disulfide oxidoreductase YuzD
MEINVVLYTIPQAACDSGKMNWTDAGKMLKEQLSKNFGDSVSFDHCEFMTENWFADTHAQELMEKNELKFPFVTVNGELASTGDKIKLTQVIRKVQEIKEQQ